MSTATLVPAAQYLRMSTEHQQYSIENQKIAIREYAKNHGFTVEKTYADAGRSGVVLKYRVNLSKLLKDVVSGNADFKAILVYDVSRWGRFQDTDEAAHYEFLCKHSGIPVHYCAEAFANDNSPSSAILKALKRTMAAEYSRELGVKTYEGQKLLVTLGFKIGGRAGYGLRRMMLSADRKVKQQLRNGEYKNIKDDRVVLVPGPKREIECVRKIYSRILGGEKCGDIARDLNLRRVPREEGKVWSFDAIKRIVTHPKYMGCYVWGRTSQKLHGMKTSVPREHWVTNPGAIAPIIDASVFERVQAKLRKNVSDLLWSDRELLGKLKRLWAKHGRLSQALIGQTRGMPSSATYHLHFGSLKVAYDALGFRTPEKVFAHAVQRKRTQQLRDEIIGFIRNTHPQNVTFFHLLGKRRPILRIDKRFSVSVIVCPMNKTRIASPRRWTLYTIPEERQNITLLCRLNANNNGFYRFDILPPLDKPRRICYRFTDRAPFLANSRKLGGLSEFYSAAITFAALNAR